VNDPKTAALVHVRPALVADTKPIMTLVNELAVRQVMLPRSPASVIENIRDFFIAEVDGQFAGCGALAVTWTDIAEIRSLAVAPDRQKHGIGRTLVDALVKDALRLGIPRLFAFTYVPAFFGKMGFTICQHEDLPHKVFNDCTHCPKFLACDEIAMTRVLDAKASPTRLFGKPQRAIPLPQRTTTFVEPELGRPKG
jgi:amino-acid N-acetyltransferase